MTGTAHDHPIPSGTPVVAILPFVVTPLAVGLSDQVIIAISLPFIARDIGAGSNIVLVSVAYLLVAAVSVPVYGKFGDAYGPRRVLAAALCLYAVGAALCAVSSNVTALALSRALQGAGGGGLLALSHAVVGVRVSRRDLARSQGYFSAIGIVANAIGPLACALLLGMWGWRAVFVAGATAALLGMLNLARLKGDERGGTVTPLDWIGLSLLAAFVAPLVLAVEKLKSLQAGSFALGGAGLVSLALLVQWLRRKPDGIFPRQLFSEASLWRSNLLVAFHGATLAALTTLLPFHLRAALGLGAVDIAQILAGISIMVSVGGVAAGVLVATRGWAALLQSWAMLVAAANLISLALFLDSIPFWQFVAHLILSALLMGTVFPVAQVIVQAAAGRSLASTVAGSIQLSRSIGAAFGAALTGVTLSRLMGEGNGGELPAVASDGTAGQANAALAAQFGTAYELVGGFAIVTLLIAWWIPMRRLKPD